MKKLLVLLSLVSFISYSDNISLIMENDSFSDSGDNDYTHGTCIKYQNNEYHYILGQNIYAPNDLKRKDHIEGDRPYAGYLYFGLGKEYWINNWSHYFELDLGVIGPSSFSEESQRVVHKLIGARDPQGWDNQLNNEVTGTIQYWTKYNILLCDYVSIIPRGGLILGNVQDAVEIGCDLKLGYNFKNDIGNSILFSESKKSMKDDLSIYVYIGTDERYYLYNHFLEGSLFNDDDKYLKVDIEHFVWEYCYGIGLRYKNFEIKYYIVNRDKEFKTQKTKPDYGGLSITWNW